MNFVIAITTWGGWRNGLIGELLFSGGGSKGIIIELTWPWANRGKLSSICSAMLSSTSILSWLVGSHGNWLLKSQPSWGPSLYKVSH